jgi:hypothetical protein
LPVGELIESLALGREELGVDAGGVVLLLNDFDLHVPGVGKGDRQSHITGFAAVEGALLLAAQHVPGTDPQREP